MALQEHGTKFHLRKEAETKSDAIPIVHLWWELLQTAQVRLLEQSMLISGQHGTHSADHKSPTTNISISK